jgi:hypothetical protein
MDVAKGPGARALGPFDVGIRSIHPVETVAVAALSVTVAASTSMSAAQAVSDRSVRDQRSSHWRVLFQGALGCLRPIRVATPVPIVHKAKTPPPM